MKRKPSARQSWIAWLKAYGAGKLFDAILRNCQGAKSKCRYCGEDIYFDIVEGGGCPDWGTRFGDGGKGLDYGCADSPDTCEDGTGGHLPEGVAGDGSCTCAEHCGHGGSDCCGNCPGVQAPAPDAVADQDVAHA